MMSAKVKDNKNRWRSKTVGFRVSPEEWAQFELTVSLSGLSKQEYLIARIQQREIIAQPNPRMFRALRNELAKVLERLNEANEPDGELLDTIKLIATTLNGLKEEPQ